MTNEPLDGREALEEYVATLKQLSGKWWGKTPADLKRSWGKYQGKWVVFDCFEGCLYIRKDAKRALAEARKHGYSEPHLYLYDVSADKVYLPDGSDYDPDTYDLHTKQMAEAWLNEGKGN
jgi:hypothetical protein